ncbi:MAG TPA: phospholipase D-like domain-containing protein [Candidatus Acidoferrum sp.]|nr:phospholipase D-like domain-containing protein [Candidatus Acidoferrum sp.]
MIIDEQMVISGSFNFTKAAEERNAENVLIIDEKAIAAKYLRNWQQHAAHSEPYVRATSNSKSTKPKAPSREEQGWGRFFRNLIK